MNNVLIDVQATGELPATWRYTCPDCLTEHELHFVFTQLKQVKYDDCSMCRVINRVTFPGLEKPASE